MKIQITFLCAVVALSGCQKVVSVRAELPEERLMLTFGDRDEGVMATGVGVVENDTREAVWYVGNNCHWMIDCVIGYEEIRRANSEDKIGSHVYIRDIFFGDVPKGFVQLWPKDNKRPNLKKNVEYELIFSGPSSGKWMLVVGEDKRIILEKK